MNKLPIDPLPAPATPPPPATTDKDKAAADAARAAKQAECVKTGHEWSLPAQNPFNTKKLATCDATCKICLTTGKLTIG
jgi:hypothetical protein